MDKKKTAVAAGGLGGINRGMLATIGGDIKGSWISSSSTCECYKCKAKTPLRKCEHGYICEGCYKEKKKLNQNEL